ncbi:hypothetical protein ACTFIW_001938 [Dictyostelium discoideum]
MSVDANKVKFFFGKNCTGESFEYNKGETVRFNNGDKWNDKFMSCLVGSNVRCNIWEHNEIDTPTPGKFQELLQGSTNNDLTSINGLSKFQVLPGAFQWAVDVKIVNKVNSTAGSYEMTITPYNVEKVACKDGDDFVQLPIPKLTPADSEIVCHLTVRQTKTPYDYVVNGSVYFKYSPTTGQVAVIKKDETFPKNMTVTQDDNTSFIFNLNSEK